MKFFQVPFLVFLLAGTTQAFAQDAFDSGSLREGSLASKDQAAKINKAIHAWLAKQGAGSNYSLVIKKNKDSLIAEINKTLTDMKLPTINAKSPDLQMGISQMSGLSSSSFAGVEFVDGKSKFCFPCALGHNNFEWGIVPYEKSKRNASGPFYHTLQCFEAMDAIVSSEKNQINSDNFPGTRFIPIVGREDGREGFYVVTDETVYFYPAELPKGFEGENGFYKIYNITLPNGKKTIVELRKAVSEPKVTAFEVKNKPVKSEVTVDLGAGVGDKITQTSLAAIRNEVIAQIDRAPFSKVTCPALNQCRKDKNMKEVLHKLNALRTDFACSNSNEGIGADSGAATAVPAN